MPERATDQPDINPGRVASDPLLAEIAAMVAYMDLHIGRYQVSQLSTKQKEIWADLVDSANVNAQESWRDEARRTTRWWRDDYDGPTSEADPRWHDPNYREPDPFLYSPGQRRPETIADHGGYPCEGAVRVARAALLDVIAAPHHPERRWLAEDFAAVYEWAKRAVQPSRNSEGAIVPGHQVYPAPLTAEAFLAEHRAARAERQASRPAD